MISMAPPQTDQDEQEQEQEQGAFKCGWMEGVSSRGQRNMAYDASLPPRLAYMNEITS